MSSSYQRPCQGGPCTEIGMAIPGFCKCKQDAERICALENLVRELAMDLENEIDNRYSHGIKDHPAMKPKYERDMEVCRRARGLLAAAGSNDEAHTEDASA